MDAATTAPVAETGTGAYAQNSDPRQTNAAVGAAASGGQAKQSGRQHFTTPPPAWRAIDLFRDAIMDAGLGDPGRIIADGEVHRFRTEDDKPGAKSGWYSLHLDGCPAGVFGSWREGSTQTSSAP